MSLPIPEKFQDLFSRPILCGFTSINPDGQPHSVPVWCDFDGEHVRVNLRLGTKKVRNVQTNTRVSLLVIDPQNPGHWVEIQGQLIDPRDEAHGAREHIHQLSEKYTGKPYSRLNPAHPDRQMYLVEAKKINGN